MITAAYVLLAINLAALLAVAAWALRLRAEVASLRLRTEALSLQPPPPAELLGLMRGGTPSLAIHILNPMELAAQKHWVAGAFARLTPGIVRHFVGREAARIVAQELPKYGVIAEVRVLEADTRVPEGA